MSLALAVIADDLTGALDTGAPFATLGLTTRVALRHEALDEALAGGVEILGTNTASRALSPAAAAERVAGVARRILGHDRPRIVFKKIDSRLKGHIAAESAAIARVFGLERAVVAPAVPDQDRWTVDGAVAGRGLSATLPVAPLFAGTALDVDVANATDAEDLDRLVARTDWARTLAIGARGLGQAVARFLADASASPTQAAPPRTDRVLFAFGSRDPITVAQVARLRATRRDLTEVAAADGRVPEIASPPLPLVVRCVGARSESPAEVAMDFAEGVVRLVRDARPELLVMGGGDTAFAICRRFGADVATPLGEAAPGLPWLTLSGEGGETLNCVVKSGGFGGEDVLADLLAGVSGDIAGSLQQRTGGRPGI